MVTLRIHENIAVSGPGSAETVNFSYLVKANSKLFTDKRMKKFRVAFFTLLCYFECLVFVFALFAQDFRAVSLLIEKSM